MHLVSRLFLMERAHRFLRNVKENLLISHSGWALVATCYNIGMIYDFTNFTAKIRQTEQRASVRLSFYLSFTYFRCFSFIRFIFNNAHTNLCKISEQRVNHWGQRRQRAKQSKKKLEKIIEKKTTDESKEMERTRLKRWNGYH